MKNKLLLSLALASSLLPCSANSKLKRKNTDNVKININVKKGGISNTEITDTQNDNVEVHVKNGGRSEIIIAGNTCDNDNTKAIGNDVRHIVDENCTVITKIEGGSGNSITCIATSKSKAP